MAKRKKRCVKQKRNKKKCAKTLAVCKRGPGGKLFHCKALRRTGKGRKKGSKGTRAPRASRVRRGAQMPLPFQTTAAPTPRFTGLAGAGGYGRGGYRPIY